MLDWMPFGTLVEYLDGAKGRVAVFLGSGCSVSSGIPSGKELVTIWQRELYEKPFTETTRFEEWLEEHNSAFADWLQLQYPDELNPEIKRYGYTFGLVCPTRVSRQQRIATLCESARPQAGYFALAALAIASWRLF